MTKTNQLRRLGYLACLVAVLTLGVPALATAQGVMFVTDNKVGIGIDTPGFQLHVFGDDARIQLENENAVDALRTMFVMENNGPPAFSFRDQSPDGKIWNFRGSNAGNFTISEQSSGVNEAVFKPGGNLTLAGEITTSGSCSVGCDAVFLPEYELESIEEHASFMWANNHLKGVGPTAEEGQYSLTQKTLGVLNELEKAHIYIEQLHQRLEALEQRLDEQQ